MRGTASTDGRQSPLFSYLAHDIPHANHAVAKSNYNEQSFQRLAGMATMQKYFECLALKNFTDWNMSSMNLKF